MPVNCLLIALSGFFLTLVFIFLFKRFFVRHRILMPRGIPLAGGIAIGLSFTFVSLLGLFLCRGFSHEVIGIIISSFAMLIFGVIDDWRELSIKAKFFVQIIAALLLISFGIRTQIVYIGDLANIIITFIWVLGITNAINHLDVMDAVAAGTALFASMAFFAIAVFNGDIRTATLSLALAATLFGFLFYNLPPAKIYMGNSGSHFLGFVLAAVALVASYAPMERKIALLSPIVILGLPIFDTAFLILVRIIKKSVPFKKSNDHLALIFLSLGYSKRKTLLIMVGLCLLFSISGVCLSQVSNLFGAGIIIFLVLVSLALTVKMGRAVLYK